MAIRIRKVDGLLIAICAARSIPKPGDIYLDDAEHYALAIKFQQDYGLLKTAVETNLMDKEESDNLNRLWWDSMYAKEQNQ